MQESKSTHKAGWTAVRHGPGMNGATSDGSARQEPSKNYEERHSHAKKLAVDGICPSGMKQ